MAKDPAFLFYSSDFLTGTMFMTDDQVGKYIRLLCAQHQKGPLSEKDMLKICLTQDPDIWDKFIKGPEGFYNARLQEESEKRKKYSKSRSENRKKKDPKDMINTSKTYVNHMENENENENIDDNYIIIGGEKVFDAIPVLEYYEAQLNGTQKEHGNIAWRPLVKEWFNNHLQEEFKDGSHVKNSFKKFYLYRKPATAARAPRQKAFKL